MIKATTAAPMPIPAFAPVESPLLVATGTGVNEDVGLEVGVALDVGVLEGWGVVDGLLPAPAPEFVLVLVVIANAACTVMGCPHI